MPSPAPTPAVTGTTASPATAEEPAEVHGLARKLTCNVCIPTIAGVVFILLCQIFLTLDGAATWGSDARVRMVDLEAVNLQRLAQAKSGTIEEHFGRVRESTLQLQSFAGQAIITEPESMVRVPADEPCFLCACGMFLVHERLVAVLHTLKPT